MQEPEDVVLLGPADRACLVTLCDHVAANIQKHQVDNCRGGKAPFLFIQAPLSFAAKLGPKRRQELHSIEYLIGAWSLCRQLAGEHRSRKSHTCCFAEQLLDHLKDMSPFGGHSQVSRITVRWGPSQGHPKHNSALAQCPDSAAPQQLLPV